MKKLTTIISVILTISLFSCVPAYADVWETEPIDFKQTTSDSAWETEPIDGVFDFDEPVSISKCKVSNIVNKTYNGNKRYQSFTVKYNKKTLVKGTHYTLSYKNNVKVGTATVTIKGKGVFTGSVIKTFKINPKGTKITSLSRPKTRQIKVKWNRQKVQTKGYQIKYATNKNFKSAKYVTIDKNTSSVKTFKKLKKNKKYYFRIRTYKIVNGQKYTSSWSNYRAITAK